MPLLCFLGNEHPLDCYTQCDICSKSEVCSLIVTRNCHEILGRKGTLFSVCDECLERWFEFKEFRNAECKVSILQWNCEELFYELHPFCVFFHENPDLINTSLLV
jgi:hypothetical protein